MSEKMTVLTDPLSQRLLKEGHILISGTTGSGKSTLLDTLLYNMCFKSADEIVIVIIDLKMVSLISWKKAPQVERYADTPSEALSLLQDVEYTMYKRFDEMKEKELKMYDGRPIYVIIDEAAELFDSVNGSKEYVKTIARLGRAARVNIVLSTQSPNRKTIPADVTLNFMATVALRCKSKIESKQITGYEGAEKLPRYGKALYMCPSLMEPEIVNVNMTPEEDIAELIDFYNRNIQINSPQG